MNPTDVGLLRDEEVMRHAFAAIPLLAEGSVWLRTLALERFWVKPGRHCHAAYRLGIDTDRGAIETLASASLLRDERRGPAVLREARALPAARAPWTSQMAAAVVGAPRALVQLFPWDHRLPTLAQALDPEQVTAALGVEVLAAEHVGYWPGMRCQLRYTIGDGVRYGKVFPDASGADVARRTASVTRALGEADTLAVPVVQDWLASLRLLVTKPLPGTPLIDHLERGDGATLIAPVAAALARFHRLDAPDVERRFRPTDDLAVVSAWVTFTTGLFPALGAALGITLARIESARPRDDDRPAVLVHRDFYDRQVLVHPSRIGILDLDTVCRGDPEIDVGNFCAHLTLRGLQWHDDAAALAGLAAAFIDAYRRHRPDVDLRRVAWYRASTLLRLACVYALRPWWHGLAPRLLEESRRALS